ncbi:biotin-independent malonate decarboxylase subunit beta [Hansschlegelia sp. KR7-227]|uniref:biotin-independent malonate decarboxylase subunit beta n=1 Tax=Hansschlegelia sp. KR7-227 TaxID=3400914 RepID=UPI003C09EFB2
MRVARNSFYEATARGRVRALLDAGSFTEFCPPAERRVSPHLPALGLPVAFDDGVVVGEGTLGGRPVLIAAQEGGFMGGAVGEVHGAKITGILERATDVKPDAVVLLLDTGGVRLHEANAGLVAMGEIQRAALGARHAGVPVIVAIGGKNGCYGGMSIVARSCDWIIASEEGRLSISGPEVIEAVEGIEEFDAQDRALVWRTMGAKHRRLIGEIDALVADDVEAFRTAIAGFLGRSRPLDLDALEAEHAALRRRLERFADCADGTDVWARLGVNDPGAVPSLDAERFNSLVDALGRAP